MTSVIIKRTGPAGKDTKTFRAFRNIPRMPDRKASLHISASTTGNEDWGVRTCARKAFIQFTEPYADPDEIETRIRITPLAADAWLATLQPKTGL